MFWLTSLLAAARLIVAPADSTSLGYAPFTTIDAQHRDTVVAAIWYPSTSAARDTVLGLQPMRIALNGAVAATAVRRPVVLVSHGTGGTEFGHWDTVDALVAAGYIVVTVRHTGDNPRDRSAQGTDRYLYGRPSHLKVTLDHLLADPAWAARVDPARIGVFGFSAGAMTALQLVGGRPDTALLRPYCQRHPSDPQYCTADGLGGHFRFTGRYTGPTADPRIRSAVLWGPAWGFLFDRAGLAAVHVPLLMVRGGSDSVVVEPDNAEHLLAALPARPQLDTIAGIGHFTFLAPCSAAFAKAVPEICHDLPGVSRSAVHARLNARMVQFFDRTLAIAPTPRAPR